jgi:hypothetical protein
LFSGGKEKSKKMVFKENSEIGKREMDKAVDNNIGGGGG